jgi:hypothetical protein
MYENEHAGRVTYQGIFFESCLKIKENIISTASSFGRITDKGQESYLSNPTPNPTLGVFEITRLRGFD